VFIPFWVNYLNFFCEAIYLLTFLWIMRHTVEHYKSKIFWRKTDCSK